MMELYVVLAGLVVGSYLNVVIHRLPRSQSTVLPRSRCPGCGTLIRPWDNIPLLSYLVLRGRCRSCRTPISWRYPAVEAANALCYFGCYVRFGATVEGLIAAAFCSSMIVLATIDVEHYILPDVITLPGIVVGLLLQRWLPWSTFLEAVVGVLVGGGILLLVAQVWYWLRKVDAMGMGDVKMLAMVGAFLGWQGVVMTLFLGSLAGSVVGVGLMVSGKLGMQSKLPFGFFLALGALLTLLTGRELLAAYLAATGQTAFWSLPAAGPASSLLF